MNSKEQNDLIDKLRYNRAYQDSRNASNILYDNTASTLISDKTQDAIDELDSKVSGAGDILEVQIFS